MAIGRINIYLKEIIKTNLVPIGIVNFKMTAATFFDFIHGLVSTGE